MKFRKADIHIDEIICKGQVNTYKGGGQEYLVKSGGPKRHDAPPPYVATNSADPRQSIG